MSDYEMSNSIHNAPAMKEGRPEQDSSEDLEILHELKQDAAKESGSSRYYGGVGTIHGSQYLDIQLDVITGEIRAVWFRCQLLPFKTSCVTGKTIYNPINEIGITGVEIKEADSQGS